MEALQTEIREEERVRGCSSSSGETEERLESKALAINDYERDGQKEMCTLQLTRIIVYFNI